MTRAGSAATARRADRGRGAHFTFRNGPGATHAFREMIGDLRQDLRYAFRTLRRDAGFTPFAVVIIGARHRRERHRVQRRQRAPLAPAPVR